MYFERQYIVAPLVFSVHKSQPQINTVSYFSALAFLNELLYSVAVKQHGDVLINRSVQERPHRSVVYSRTYKDSVPVAANLFYQINEVTARVIALQLTSPFWNMRDTSVFHYSRTKHPCPPLPPPSFSLSTSYLLCPWGTALALGPASTVLLLP